MSDLNLKNDVLDFAGDGKPTLPSGLNVLTILTIIGSILGLISSIWSYVSSKATFEKMRETVDSGNMDKMPGWMKGMVGPDALVMYQKMYENRLPLLLIGLVGSILCLYGAMEMRKLKKQGYILWLIGEIVPVFGMLLFIGTGALHGFGLIGLLFPIVFIILYTANRKYLIH